MAKNRQFEMKLTIFILQYNAIINLVEPRIHQIKMPPSCPDYEIHQLNTLPSFADLQYISPLIYSLSCLKNNCLKKEQ